MLSPPWFSWPPWRSVSYRAAALPSIASWPSSRIASPDSDNSDCALDSVSSYHDQLAQHCAPERLVDSLTWDDLEMDRVFCRINACQSSVGEEVLFHQLHAPCFDVSTLARREELLQALEAQPQRRVALQALLAQLGKLNYSGLPSLLFEPEQRILPHAWVYRVLAWLPALGLPLLFLKPVLGLAWIVTCAVVNAFLYAYMKIRWNPAWARYATSPPCSGAASVS